MGTLHGLPVLQFRPKLGQFGDIESMMLRRRLNGLYGGKSVT